jgi:hypothetical protein
MTITLLELNDLELRLWREDDTVVSEPGWALLTEPPVVGQMALDQARLQPRLTSCQFWHALNTDPMPGATQAARHHADLAYLQLTALKGAAPNTEFAVCVPGHYDRTDLSLLLGLMAAADLSVKALIDPGLLLARCAASTTPNLLYLDAGLHAVTLTVIQQGPQLHRSSCRIAHSAGYLNLIDRLANSSASALVRKSRFDPLQQASTEQQLFKQLLQPDHPLDGLGRGLISLHHDGAQYDVQLSETDLRAATADLVPDVVTAIRAATNGPTEVLISHRAHRLPGLIESLSLVPGLVTQSLTSTSLLEAFVDFTPELAASAAHNQLIYSLANPSRKTETNTEPASRDLSVSHVVQHGVAINIATFSETTSQDFELALDSTSNRWQLIPGSASIALNEQPLTEPRFIKPGDAVLTGNQAFQFIQVR